MSLHIGDFLSQYCSQFAWAISFTQHTFKHVSILKLVFQWAQMFCPEWRMKPIHLSQSNIANSQRTVYKLDTLTPSCLLTFAQWIQKLFRHIVLTNVACYYPIETLKPKKSRRSTILHFITLLITLHNYEPQELFRQSLNMSRKRPTWPRGWASNLFLLTSKGLQKRQL
jgi:hypothetical protein